jgi:hypothetical protein
VYTAVIVNVVPGAKVSDGQVILAIPPEDNVSTIPKTNCPVGVLFALNCIDPTVGVDKSDDLSVAETKETTVHSVNVVIPPTIDTLVVVVFDRIERL